MRIHLEDSVILTQEPSTVGIIERRQGDTLTIRFPARENKREQVSRGEVRALAEVMYETRRGGGELWKTLNLMGESTLADLVRAFGYDTQRLRSESRERVVRQLERAGLEVRREADGWDRDEHFRLILTSIVALDIPDSSDGTLKSHELFPVALPEPFWPTALGLDANLEQTFLRALTEAPPILCLLHVPDDTHLHGWLQATWEGIISWAFHAAQRFMSLTPRDRWSPQVFIGPPTVLQAYFEASVLQAESPRLRDGPHSLNLISLKKSSDSPVDFSRLRAAWPGPVLDFTPEPSIVADGQPSEDIRALVKCLLLTSGSPTAVQQTLSPLKTLLWSKQACMQILAGASISFGEILASGELSKFKGSNEGSTALALKAHLARWIKRKNKNAALRFEENQVQQVDEWGNACETNRIDLFVEGQGRFEVESMAGSGPIEAFYHQKVFARLKRDGAHFWLVVPNEAVLWAGPYLADLAHHLSPGGSVLIPSLGEAYLTLKGRPLSAQEIEVPWDELHEMSAIDSGETRQVEVPVRLKDVAGYKEMLERVEELVIWPEKHRRALRRPSRSSGILFFGPPGCGKSRLARAIAGELDQEVRLLSPSDLRGPYIGWGQIMIREQFDWVAQHERPMLVIDEIDAVARSRRMMDNMHSDEMANVNELLVQLDRVSRLGRLVVGTTNLITSLDDAVVRSGRFGRFVPVPPPDINEAIDILNYYLKSLVDHEDTNNQPHVQVPEAEELPSILRPLLAENAAERRFSCGADLEEAVNRTYQRCLRAALGDDTWPEDYARVNVNLTAEELTRSLRDVPRSVTEEAVEQFIMDIKRYCGSAVGSQFEKRLGFEG